MKMTGKVILACVSMLGCTGAFAAENAGAGIDWKARLPEIRSVVQQTFPRETAEAHYPASISRTADLTGTGESEALVDLGSGEYTDEFTVVRMEGDTPVVARFRSGKDEKAAPMVFLSGQSEGKGEAVELRPREHVIYTGHWLVSGTGNGMKVKKCHGEAYEWDAESKSFSLSKKMGKVLTREFCQKLVADAAKAQQVPGPEDPAKPAAQKLD